MSTHHFPDVLQKFEVRTTSGLAMTEVLRTGCEDVNVTVTMFHRDMHLGDIPVILLLGRCKSLGLLERRDDRRAACVPSVT